MGANIHVTDTSSVRGQEAAPVRFVRGWVDACREEDGALWLVGWAFAPGRQVWIAVTHKGASAGSGVANIQREDLKDAGLGDGACAFAIRLSIADATVDPADLKVVCDGTFELSCEHLPLLVRAEPPTVLPAHSAPDDGHTANPNLRGWVDALYEEDGRLWLSGWAFTPGHHVSVVVMYEGRIVGSGDADIRREGLEDAGMGDGACAFLIELAISEATIRPEQLNVRCDGAMALSCAHLPAFVRNELEPSPIDTDESRADDADTVRGWVDACFEEDNRLWLTGWAFTPDRVVSVVVLHDDQIVGRGDAKLTRDGLREAGLGDGNCAFKLELDLPGAEINPAGLRVLCDDAVELSCAHLAPFTRAPVVPPIAATPAEADRVKGWVDACYERDGRLLLSGWALASRGHVSISVFQEDVAIGRGVANLFRPGLQKAALGDGDCAFSVELDVSDSHVDPTRFRVLCNDVFELSCAHLPPVSRGAKKRTPITRYVEKVVRDRHSLVLGGWAFDAGRPDHHVNVRAHVDGSCVGLAVASQMRSDLAAAGMAKGDHAFSMRLPLWAAEKLGDIVLTFDGRGDWRFPETAEIGFRDAPARRILALDPVQICGSELRLSGWVLEPENLGARAIVVCQLGEQRITVEACEERRDLAVRGWPRECGFSTRIALKPDQDPSHLVIHTLDGAALDRFPTWFNFVPPRQDDPMVAAGAVGVAHVHNGELRGWLLGEAGETGLDLRVEEEGRIIWQGVARRLASAPVNGRKQKLPCGFRVVLPRPQHPSLLRSISILRSNGEHAPGSPLQFPDGLEFAGYVEGAGKVGDSVIVTGWCVNRARPSQPVEIECVDAHGAILATTVANAPRPDLKALEIETPFGGFRLQIEGSRAEAAGSGLRIRPVGALGVLPTASCFLENIAVLAESAPVGELPMLTRASDEIEGHVDEISSAHVRGWARAKGGERLVLLDLFLDNVLTATTAARRFRADLATLFTDHGCHEFLFELTTPLIWQASSVKVRPRTGVGEISSKSDTLPQREIVNTAMSGMPARRVLSAHLWETDARPERFTVSIIVLNRDGAPLLDAMFQSFFEHNTYENIEFIIVDHASHDDSEAVCLRWRSRFAIDFARRDGNYSFSDSNNWGASRAVGDILLFMNNDVRLCEDVLAVLIRHLSDDRAGCVGVRLLDDTLEDRAAGEPRAYAAQHLGVHLNLSQQSAKVIAPFETRLSRLWGRTAHRSVRVPAVTGAFFAMRRSLFDRIGGFDEAYYYGQEDVDLCLQVRAAGYEVICANEVSAFHLRAYSRDTMDTRYHHARRRNALTLDKKFGSPVRRALAQDRFERPGFWTGEAPRIALIVTSVDPATQAGDLFTARELASALIEQFPVTCVFVEQDGPHVRNLSGIDVVIAMRDDFDPDRIQQHDPHLLKIAWIRNWFKRFADSAHADRYHAIWSSSEYGARLLRETLGRPVSVLPIAANAKAFAPRDSDERYESDYCFTGSYWGANREIIQSLEPAALPYEFALFGQGWETVASMRPYARGFVHYADMPLVYASTKVVVDDANHATKAFGSVNSRVYDAIAAGAVVLTNGALGAREQFGDALPIYSTPQELEALLHLYLTDESARRAKATELRAIVLEKHTYAHRAREAWALLRGIAPRPRVAIKIGAPTRSVREEWGDWHFARGIQEALEALGYAVRIDCLSEWSNRESAGDDIVFVLRGLSQYAPRKDQINLLWVISHPELVSEGEFGAYDHVFVASETFREQLEPLLGDKVSTLLQCANPRFFHPGVTPVANAAPALFVGNSREQKRPIVADAIEAGLDLHVHGTRWDGFIPDRYIKGAHIPNDSLAAHYRAAGALLNDHWPTMRERGFISNRIFDALACGARVVSDEIAGVEALSDGLVRVYSTPQQLLDICRSLANETSQDQARRDEIARHIIRDHSFGARMRDATVVMQKLLDARPLRLS